MTPLKAKAVKAYLLNRDNENPPKKASNILMNSSGNDLIQRWHFSLLDPTSHMLISVPGPKYGVITVGYSFLQYYNHLSKSECTVYAETMTSFITCTPIDQNGYRYLMSDAEGSLYLLILVGDSAVNSMQLQKLGQTSIASCLCYLDSGLVFIGSELGSTQLIRLESNRQSDGQFLSILDNLVNIGPILDAIHLDTEKDTLIACAGAFQSSSIKIINSGVAAIITHSLDFPGHLVRGVTRLDEGILINTPFNNYLLDSDHNTMTKTSPESHPTHSHSIESKMTVEARLGKPVLADSVLEHHIYASGNKILFSSPSNTLQREFEAEVSAIKIINNSPCIALLTSPPTIFCGADLCFTLNSTSFVTSICSYLDMILFGMADGNLLIYKNDGSQTCLPVGTNPVKLFGLNNDVVLICSDQARLFRVRNLTPECPIINLPNESTALYEPTSIAYPLNKLDFILVRQTRIDICSFSEDPYLHKTSESLHVQSIQISHLLPPIDSFPFTARHLTRHAQTNTIAVTANNYPGPGPIGRYRACTPVSKLLSLNERTLELLDSFDISSINATDKHRLNAQSIKSFVPPGMTEEIIVVGAVHTEIMTRTDDPDPQGFLPRENVVPGQLQSGIAQTATSKPLIRRRPVVIKGHPDTGKVLVFGIFDGKITLLALTSVEGCPYDIEVIRDLILVAVNGTVSVFQWSTAGAKNGKLVHVYDQKMQVACLNLNTLNDHLVVGDLMRSVSLWRLPSSPKNELELQARDSAYHWTTSAVVNEEGHILASDNSCNLLSYQQQDDKLKRVAVWHLGEPVNKIIRSRGNSFTYLTATGSIGTITSINVDTYKTLKSLEQRLQLPTLASLSRTKWHSFKDDRQIITVDEDNNGVIDGEVLTAFLQFEEAGKSELVDGIRDEEGALVTAKCIQDLVHTLLAL